MNYDEDLLVELIAGGDVSQTDIAEKVGVSRRTVWRIANGHSRADLQQRIADTVEGYRQAAIRLAARFMKPLLEKQIEVALESNGETSRRCREFLLKTFMIALPQQAAKRAPGKQLDGIVLYKNLTELPPDLKDQVIKELGGPADEQLPTTNTTENTDAGAYATVPKNIGVEEPTVSSTADPPPVAKSSDKKKKEVPPPFSTKVTLPDGRRIYRETIRLIEEAEAEAAAHPPRRRVPRSPP
ncbi:MAG: winged helix-turn-helix transcriptional regulator [Phycisphaerae bacterium]|jgi:transcriptional regulator with XRE-family HTH domain|nr:winged helix-turn-helix transcriptional regulator [Phycisphaerae bacterium]